LQDQAGTIKPLSGTLPPGEALSIANRPEIGLNNSGDSVSLIDDTDAVVDHVSYTQSQAANEGWTITYG